MDRLIRSVPAEGRLAFNRCLFDARVVPVLRRCLGLSAALRTKSTSRSMAAWRFRFWVQNCRVFMIETPFSVIRRPAIRIRRSRTSAGQVEDLPTSKRSCVDFFLVNGNRGRDLNHLFCSSATTDATAERPFCDNKILPMERKIPQMRSKSQWDLGKGQGGVNNQAWKACLGDMAEGLRKRPHLSSFKTVCQGAYEAAPAAA